MFPSDFEYELLNDALMVNRPKLPPPLQDNSPKPALGPVPSPWAWAVPFLISLVATKDAASAMTNKEAAQQITATADRAIAQFLDDYCGTPLVRVHWPVSGPGPWVSVIASQLTWTANTLQEGSLRTALVQLAGRVLDRAALNPQPLPPSQ